MQPSNQYYQDHDPNQPPDWIYAFMPSYGGKAFLAFILYFCGYFPGLILNIVFLIDALSTKDRFGRAPEGLGCLVTLLFMATVGAVLVIILCYAMLQNLFPGRS